MANQISSTAPLQDPFPSPISNALRKEVLENTATVMVAVMQQYQAHGMSHDQLKELLIQLGQVWGAFR